MKPTKEQVNAGQAVYSKAFLSVYDIMIIGFSNRFLWQCSSDLIQKNYDNHISGNHLDVGVGTGYFLDKCQFRMKNPRIALMDLNENSLSFARKRILRYQPEVYVQDILEPITKEIPRFDSVGLNYLFHCLPGTFSEKAIVFDHLRPCMNKGAKIFGSTILWGGGSKNWIASNVMNLYNKKGIFTNRDDHQKKLEKILNQRFTDVDIRICGCVALFSCSYL